MADDLALAGPEFRRRALDRAMNAFERELKAGGIELDPLLQLDLLELVEKVEALASSGPMVLVSLPHSDEPVGYGWPAEDLENRLRRDVA